MKDAIYVLDAYALIYRSYFAFVSRPLTNSKGENVSAIFGFFKSLHSIFTEYEPKLFVTALDSITPTFRHEMYKEYKATRDKTPDDLHSQINKIEEILKTFKLPAVRCNGFEADDVIASIAALAEKEKRECIIISGDKDLMQLVSKTTTMLKPGKIKAWESFGSDNVKEEWGVAPENMLDLLSLIGDTADNIPGIKGVGPKTSVKLLQEYKTLDGIFKNIENLKGALKTKIETGKESAYFSKELIKLNFDVPIEKDLNTYSTSKMDYEAAAKLFITEELPNIAKLYSEKINTKKESVLPENKEEPNLQNLSEMLPEELRAGAEISLPQNIGDYHLINTADELFKITDNAISQGFAAYDCETTSENPLDTEICGFSLSLKSGEAFYFPLKAPSPELGEDEPKLISFEDAQKAVSKLFNSKICLIMHNGKFDIQAALSSELAKEISADIFDTMVAAWLLDPARSSYGMDKLAESILAVKTIRFKDIVKSDENFSYVPLQTACKYAAEDADITLRFYEKFLPLLKKNNLENLFFNIEMPITKLLTEMEIKGIYLKGEELKDYSKELGKEIEECEKDIYRLVGHEFNIASPKQLQQVLFEERKLTPGKKTKTGYSTDTSVLENLAAEDPVPAKILDYRALAKLKSTYTDTLPKMTDENGRIHTNFIQTGTATGRLSSREPNLQNIPIRESEGRKIREAFQAEKGKMLISADYSQIELVILAHISKDENLVEAFNAGIDVHAKTASLIFSVDIKDVNLEMRRIAKTINFGVMYGMSAFRLASSLRIPRKKADEFIKAYFATYSGVSAFMAGVCAEAEKKGYVETLMGRRRYLPAINSQNKIEKASAERIAVNTPIQGTAADIVKLAMLKVDKTLKEKKLKASILLQVHDELIIEADKEDTDNVKKLVKEKMENVIKLSVPLRVSIESGASWGEFH